MSENTYAFDCRIRAIKYIKNLEKRIAILNPLVKTDGAYPDTLPLISQCIQAQKEINNILIWLLRYQKEIRGNG